MSFSESINAIIMMESVALNESHIIENFDFVLVEPEDLDDNMDVDEDSYDYCDDAISMLSVENPSSLSVCSDVQSFDPTVFEVDTNKELKPERRPRLISFGNDEDEARIRSERFQASVETLDEQVAQEDTSEVSSVTESNDEKTAVEPENNEAIVENQVTDKPMDTDHVPDRSMDTVASRLSNKKRRKKTKLMKKAAAAAAAAAAITAGIVPSPPREKRVKTPKATRHRNKTSNLAVACANETLEAYRAELQAKTKRFSTFVSPV
jgi:hypothetical protein